MRTRTTRDRPAGLETIRRRFDRWRLTRRGRSRIPEELWAAAVKTAGRYGLYQTARALGLDYYCLKKRVEATGREPRFEPERQSRGPGRTTPSRRGSEEQAVATFLELAPPASGGVPECTLELEDPGGAKMRVHLKGLPAPDPTALSRSFWSVEA
jgi:hypothetical protein